MLVPQEIPLAIGPVLDALENLPGSQAVVLGGSRAEGRHDQHSDWDLGVYYRGAFDPWALKSFGEVHAPGSWGRVMNGGAWLTIGGRKSTCCFATWT